MEAKSQVPWGGLRSVQPTQATQQWKSMTSWNFVLSYNQHGYCSSACRLIFSDGETMVCRSRELQGDLSWPDKSCRCI